MGQIVQLKHEEFILVYYTSMQAEEKITSIKIIYSKQECVLVLQLAFNHTCHVELGN